MNTLNEMYIMLLKKETFQHSLLKFLNLFLKLFISKICLNYVTVSTVPTRVY